jgi:MinD superfamily P-loop ATPase
MKEIVVISGKGGTGKTTVAASLSVLAENSVVADCDVDAADLFLIMRPEITKKHDFYSGKRAIIREKECVKCGLCKELCRFDAIKVDSETGSYSVEETGCEGCGVCAYFCPEKAVDFIERLCGEWYVSKTRFGDFVHAKLGIGAENSGKLVTVVRENGKKTAEKIEADYLITDGPPGIGCPVIASITGADAVLVVTEPTLSGMSDLKRVLTLAKHFDIKSFVVVNRWDINHEITEEIEIYAKNSGAFVPGRISISRDVAKAQINGKAVVEYSDGITTQEISKIWKNITNEI